MSDKVVVRFAPSPTGYLHIGGARTAIFNWLYARKNNGKFILRIEDTDAERTTKDSIEGIVEGLKWLGLSWDQGPDFQSRYIDDHVKTAHLLVESGHAYKCFCSKETTDQKRAQAVEKKQTYLYDGACRNLTADQIAQKQEAGLRYAIRLKVPRTDGSVSFTDAVYGTIEKKYSDLEDFIIVRSNGKPLYVLSNTLDDIRDGVTHIIRGQDGLANTPKQMLLYSALNAPVPVFAHMSLTLDPKKAKISKRKHGELVAVHFYREHGFLPWAFVNFLVLLGWATKESKEIFSESELVEAFDLEGISRVNSVFNINQDDPKFFTDPKALNINAHYLRTMPVEDLFVHVKDQLICEQLWQEAYDTEKKQWLLNTIDLIRERFHLLTDFPSKGRAYFTDEFSMDPESLEKNVLKYPQLGIWMPQLAEKISVLEPFDPVSVEQVVRDCIKASGIKPGVLVNGIRVVLTGYSVGPDFVKSLVCLGRKTVADRLADVPLFFTSSD